MVFADAAMEPAPGRDIVLTLDNTEDVMDVGRILKARGLVSDEKIFFAQERLSDYHGKITEVLCRVLTHNSRRGTSSAR